MPNSSFAQIAEFISSSSTFAVSGHANPDGDCIGSVLAMVAALRQAGKQATPLLSNGAPAPAKYSFLPGFEDFVHASDYKKTPDVFIAVDTATADRLADSVKVLGRTHKTVCLDHHPGEGINCDLNHVDPKSAAAAMLVWKLAVEMLGTPGKDVATACYSGLITDTGRFQFQNTDARALECASELVAAGADPASIATEVFQTRPLPAIMLEGRMISRITLTPAAKIAYAWVDDSDYTELGAKMEDTEGLVDVIRGVDGIEIALLIRGRKDDVRCSIRAKRDVDVSLVAKKLNGGGHKAAAGFTLDGLLPDRMGDIVEMMNDVERHLLDGTYDSAFGSE